MMKRIFSKADAGFIGVGQSQSMAAVAKMYNS